jgi:DnaK suppressor protein
MTREQISAALGIVPNSVRGKVQKGQIERKVVDGKNLYRIVDAKCKPSNREGAPSPAAKPKPKYETEPVEHAEEVFVMPEVVVEDHVGHSPESEEEPEIVIPAVDARSDFDPSLVLLNQLASLRIGRGIDAIEKGDEIDLATGEISRELEARITMRQQKQMKEIQDALERLKAKEYGICEECGDPIPEQRLRLYPAARFCVRCQEEADYYEKLREETAMRGGVWREEPSDSGFGKSFEE